MIKDTIKAKLTSYLERAEKLKEYLAKNKSKPIAAKEGGKAKDDSDDDDTSKDDQEKKKLKVDSSRLAFRNYGRGS